MSNKKEWELNGWENERDGTIFDCETFWGTEDEAIAFAKALASLKTFDPNRGGIRGYITLVNPEEAAYGEITLFDPSSDTREYKGRSYETD